MTHPALGGFSNFLFNISAFRKADIIDARLPLGCNSSTAGINLSPLPTAPEASANLLNKSVQFSLLNKGRSIFNKYENVIHQI